MARCYPEKLNIFLTILLLNVSLFLLSRAIELLEVPTEPALGSLLRFHRKSKGSKRQFLLKSSCQAKNSMTPLGKGERYESTACSSMEDASGEENCGALPPLSLRNTHPYAPGLPEHGNWSSRITGCFSVCVLTTGPCRNNRGAQPYSRRCNRIRLPCSPQSAPQ